LVFPLDILQDFVCSFVCFGWEKCFGLGALIWGLGVFLVVDVVFDEISI